MTRTVHFLQSIVDSHCGGRRVRVRRHNAYDAAHTRIQTGSNDTQNDVFASEDAGNLGLNAWGSRRFHDADCGRPALAHETRNVSNSCSRADYRGLGVGVHDGCEVR